MLIAIPLILLAVVLTILVLRGFDSRRMPDLEAWHKPGLTGEFRARRPGPGIGLAGYLELEEKLYDEVERKVYRQAEGGDGQAFNRYQHGSLSDPRRISPDWNRTFQLEPDGPARGAALLLHGLTDSPYSARTLGEVFRRQGYSVLGLRVPGHGTCPGALVDVSRRDWQAAALLGARHVAERAGDGGFHIAGYSTGGALALDYAMSAAEDSSLRRPDRLFLFSPAVGVSEFARFADWHKVVSWIPYFEKLKWASIDPEFDPFKYNSFPKNAGDQVYKLTREVKRRLKRGSAAGLPPILTFQSVVDATIHVDDLVDDLYARLDPGAGSELVLFDVNRWSNFRGFLKGRPDKILDKLRSSESLPYRLTLVTNAAADRREVVARTREAGSREESERPVGASWPDQVYSLSHVAVTFPPDDPFYGSEAGDPEGDAFHLGTLAPRGERDLLRLSVGQLMRLRHNPFFPWIEGRIAEALESEGQ